MGTWAELLLEILNLICHKIHSFEDVVSFMGVCSMWRSVAVEQGLPLRSFPWLMLAETKNNKNGARDFYSLTEEKTYRFVLPKLKGKKCIETKGWIVTMSKNGEMSLVHPMTDQEFRLPHQNTFKYYYEKRRDHQPFIWRAVLSSTPSSSQESVLMVIHGGDFRLAVCRLGDKAWTDIDYRNGAFTAIEYYRGKFYAVNYPGEVWECAVQQGSKDSKLITSMKMISIIPKQMMYFKQLYLVESAGDLLMVTRDGVQYDHESGYGASKFEVFEFDIMGQGSLKATKNLGTRAIFLGHSATSCVETTRYPGLIPNSVYFTDDCFDAYHSSTCVKEGGGKDMGIYSLGDGTLNTHYSGKSVSTFCPPVWTFLTIR